VLGFETAHGNSGTGLIKDRSQYYRKSSFYKCKSAEKTGSDDHAGKPDDHRSGTHGNLEHSLLLAENTAGKRNKSVCDGKAQDLHVALVFGKSCHKFIVVSHRS